MLQPRISARYLDLGWGRKDCPVLRVYHKNRDGTFLLRWAELGIDGCRWTMSGNCGTSTTSGFLDFLLGNGSPRMDRFEPFILLEKATAGNSIT